MLVFAVLLQSDLTANKKIGIASVLTLLLIVYFVKTTTSEKLILVVGVYERGEEMQ